MQVKIKRKILVCDRCNNRMAKKQVKLFIYSKDILGHTSRRLFDYHNSCFSQMDLNQFFNRYHRDWGEDFMYIVRRY